MRITPSSGLVGFAGDTGEAANEDAAADQSVPAMERRDPDTAGWDPYEVWRTRVKAARVENEMPDPNGREAED